MTNDDDGSFRLSRRKALASIGTIGAATAAGGFATYAQFTDTEDAAITFTAGGVDGTLALNGSYNGDDLEDAANFELQQEAENGVGAALHLTDVKPGDYGCFVFDLEVTNNPAWVGSCVGYEGSTDNQVYEPEVDVDPDELDSSDIGSEVSTPGEIPQNLLMMPFYDSDLQCGFFDAGGPPEIGPQDGGVNPLGIPEGFWANSEADLSDIWSSVADGDPTTVGDGYLNPRTLEDIFNSPGSLNTMQWNNGEWTECVAPEGAEVENGCVFLNGAGSQNDTDNTQEAAPLQPGDDSLQFGYDWHMPFGTGNQVQGDEVTLQLGFTFSQVRHTSEAYLANVYAPGENTPTDGDD